MRISNLTFLPLSAPLPDGGACGMAKSLATARQTTLVRLWLEDGTEGCSEAWGIPGVNLAYLPMLQCYLLGADVLDVEQVYAQCLARHYHFGVQGQFMACLSGIDIAAKDAAGKMLGVPVHRLIGKKRWDSVHVYASGSYFTADPGKPKVPFTGQNSRYLQVPAPPDRVRLGTKLTVPRGLCGLRLRGRDRRHNAGGKRVHVPATLPCSRPHPGPGRWLDTSVEVPGSRRARNQLAAGLRDAKTAMQGIQS